MKPLLAIIAAISLIALASTYRPPAVASAARPPPHVSVDPCTQPMSELSLLQAQECRPRLEALIRAQVNEEEARKAAVRAASGYRDPPGTRMLR